MSGPAIGIDVGGTFTDIVIAAPDGRIITAKAPTTPSDQTAGVLAGLALGATELGLKLSTLLAQTERIVHGTTVATNALIEGKTARVGMLTTAGHRDVIEMREGLKPERYNLRMPPPQPLVPAERRRAVRERLRADGSVAVPLDRESLQSAIRQLGQHGVESIAICFLHSWRNPGHEAEAAAAARKMLPGIYVTHSSSVLPEIKEFERFCTTAANAAVGPIVQDYLARLERRLADEGFSGRLLIMLSHGGLASVAEAGRLAAGTVLSGPAGGVAAGAALARRGLGPALVTFDMGGTSTDIALVQDGKAALAKPRGLGEARIALPALDIATLGAGGGSIARIDASGLLQVGPESAGADPGPACYGRGGERPTVTDANLVLGLLDPTNFLGGRLDRAAAERAVAALAQPLGLTLAEAAAGIHRVVNARMADGLRLATVQRGVDPRGFTLLAFGGAAGLHASSVASSVGIAAVAVPLDAAVLSAWGMLGTELRLELSRTRLDPAGIDAEKLRADFAALEKEGRERLGWFDGPIGVRHSADMRYGEQVFEINVPLDGLDWHAAGLETAIAERFHARHEQLFTYALRDEPVVLVNARLSVVGTLPPLAEKRSWGGTEAAPVAERRILFPVSATVPVYDLPTLRHDQAILGPALIESPHTTVLVHPEQQAFRDERGWLMLQRATDPGAREPSCKQLVAET
ncbi:MAG TPA: hydantoinase/oxoprolinase family protein [Acetobacteraceae bacterium]|nr:hydantoinase/oxoprolinase family protein [Acetobacteraceae bacterium]